MDDLRVLGEVRFQGLDHARVEFDGEDAAFGTDGARHGSREDAGSGACVEDDFAFMEARGGHDTGDGVRVAEHVLPEVDLGVAHVSGNPPILLKPRKRAGLGRWSGGGSGKGEARVVARWSMARPLPVLACFMVVLAGCTGPGDGAPRESTDGDGDALAWRAHPFLGNILADGSGRTLYVFTRDQGNMSACDAACAASWPPFARANVSVPNALAERVVTARESGGGDRVLIDGRLLYYFAGDAVAGDANGQGRNGTWFVVRETDRPGALNIDFLDGPGAFEVRAMNVTIGAGASAFVARPNNTEAYPGVVMVHEWWGLNAHIEGMARALASHGYAVVAPDLFGGNVATRPEDALAQVRALDQGNATRILRNAVAHLRDDEVAPRVASLGWCFGGGQSLALALSGEPLDATVIYYGRLDTDPRNLSAITWPVLGIFGAEDQSIPVAQVREFESALNTVGVASEIHIYEGVGHAFANPSGSAYTPSKAMDAWAKTLAFLKANLPT